MTRTTTRGPRIPTPRRQLLLCATILALGAGPQAALAGAQGGRVARAETVKAEKRAETGAPDPAKAGKEAAQETGERVAFTAGEAAAARPLGLSIPARIPGDDTGSFQRLIDGASQAGEPWLVLSGGGENGAFAAGLLNGWSAAGDRPRFGVVTGVSTGAMIAPFAFLGSADDPVLKEAYTTITAADVFEFGGSDAALTDTWPLKERIDRAVTPVLLKAVAAEHARGRRLLVATTEVDAERPVLWDMGAIASAGGPKALALFRAIVLASSAVPGVFPPVMLDAVAPDGKAFQEMHADGGTMAPFYLAPAAGILGRESLRIPARTVYLVVNNRLTPEFQVAPRTTLGVLGRAMSAAIKAQTQGALALTETYAARTGLDLRVAQIDGRFTQTTSAPFDQGYMQALFAYGERTARAGTAFAPIGRPDARAGQPQAGQPQAGQPQAGHAQAQRADLATGSVGAEASERAPGNRAAGR